MSTGTVARLNSCQLPTIRYIETSFSCRLTTDAVFSAYKGSMLRGSLGANLRKGLCMARKNDCAACMLAPNCIFPRIFNPVQRAGIPAAPPFCLEPDTESRCNYATGELFEFKLKLFSYGVEYLPFFVQAFRTAGEKGMGSPRQAGKFVIEKITSQGKTIYDPANDELKIPQSQQLPAAEAEGLWGSTGLGLRICTPLRHKAANHFSASLEFIELFHLILRRIKALCLIDGSIWSLEPAQYEALRTAAAEIRITKNNLRWQDWTRYSSRQEAFMKFGGLMGKITYSGNITPVFKDIMQFARVAHIGKQTSFGLGRVEPEYF